VVSKKKLITVHIFLILHPIALYSNQIEAVTGEEFIAAVTGHHRRQSQIRQTRKPGMPRRCCGFPSGRSFSVSDRLRDIIQHLLIIDVNE